MPLLNLRLAQPDALIDLNRIPGLSYIRVENDKVVIGGLTRQREMEFSQLLAKELPLLAEAIPLIGHPAIRNRGTLGGSVAHADPAAELPCVLTALDASFIAAGPTEERTIPAEDFFIGFYATSLTEREILKEVRIPLRQRPVGWSFLEFARRHGDFALGEVSVLLYSQASDDRCTSARVVVGGGSVDKPLRIAPVEKLIEDEFSRGLQPTAVAHLLAKAEELCQSAIKSNNGGRGESEYLSHLSGVLTRRALETAIRRWTQS